MILPFINQTNRAAKAFLTGGLLGGVSLGIPLFYCLVVYGPDLTAINIFASFTLIQKVNIGNFFQRIDVVVAIVAFICVYFKATICFYISMVGFAQTLQLNDYRLLSYPMGIILIVFSIIAYPNLTYASTFIEQTWMPYASTFGIWLPLLLLSVAAVRKRHVRFT